MELDRALELAVVSSWGELVNPGESCSIHLEYENISELPLNFAEVWKIKNRGYGTLICRYSAARSGSLPSGPETPTMRFANSYHSEILAGNLDFILQDQREFSRPRDRSIHGLVQIDLPSEDERKIAAAWSHNVHTDLSEEMAVGAR
jgi:hypothetical protein